MRITLLALAAASLASMAPAEIVNKPSDKPVSETMDALEAAVTGAGATVFARVDHGAGAASVNMDLLDAQLLIFGNPSLGTPVMQMDMLAGLQLPLHVLVHQVGDGMVHVSYESTATMLEGLNVDLEAEVIGKIEGALDMLTDKAVQ